MEIQKRCKCCGKPFIAKSFNARFCSKKCTDKAYKDRIKKERYREFLKSEENKTIKEIEMALEYKPILSPTEAAKLIGVSRATLYRYLATGVFKCIQFRGKTRIRRSDIEKAFNNAPDYRKRRNPRGLKPTSEFYTTAQVMEKYHIGKKCVLGRCLKHQIPKFYQGRNVYWNKAEIEKHFADLLEVFNRDEYYSTDDMMEMFGMTRGAVLTFVMRHRVPRVGHGKLTYYSKLHIDCLKGISEGNPDPDYYTIQEIKDKYNLTKDQIGYMVKKYGIHRTKVGKNSRISRTEFDISLRKRYGELTILSGASSDNHQ